MQKIFDMDTQALDAYIKDTGVKRILLVCGKSAAKLKIGEYFESLRGKRFLFVICWWDFALLHVASWGGWFTGNGNTWVQCLFLVLSFL